MRTRIKTVLACLLLAAAAQSSSAAVLQSAGSPGAEPVLTVMGAEFSDPVTPTVFNGDVRQLPSPRVWQPGDAIREIPKGRPGENLGSKEGDAPSLPHLDPLIALQRDVAEPSSQRGFNTPILDFAGGGFSGVNPPDTVGAVGLEHYVQAINGSSGTQVRIYNKATGAIEANFTLHSLGSGQCGSGAGDPIVLFDTLASRWLISEFTAPGTNRMCVYISQTSNPITGGWFAYNFGAPSFPDYPKYAVWPDAYYVGTNENTLGLYAFDRVRMLAGQPATIQRLSTSKLSGFGFQALQPADIDGSQPPPTGAPGIFARHLDTEVHNVPGFPSVDFIELFEMRVNWTTPANTSLTGPIRISIAEIDSTLCGLTSFQCFLQPNGVRLDPLREVIMWRLAYRNFGTHEAMVGTFVTDVGTDLGGKRWFELRRTGGIANSWQLHQEGTYTRPDNLNRFMGSIAQDRLGNIALAYGANNASTHPSIRYVGRLSNSPSGTMPFGEHTIVQGGASNSSNRWGDYSSLNVDPVDDCTFWYTHQFNPSSGQWQTRITSFAFDECFGAGFDVSVDPTELAICAPGDLDPISVNVTGFNDYSAPVTLSLVDAPKGLIGSFAPNPVAPGEKSVGSFVLDNTAVAGSYPFQLLGVGAGAPERSVDLNLTVSTQTPSAALLSSPANGQPGVAPTATTFSWEPAAGAIEYTLEISAAANFNPVLFSVTTTATSATVDAPLAPDRNYYWRVRARNACGTGSNSAVFNFRTSVEFCRSPNVAIPDNVVAGVNDNLVVSGSSATLQGLRLSLDITHTYVGDLIITLTHVESGTTRTLLNRPREGAGNCSGNNMLLTLDDAATLNIQSNCTSVTNPGQAYVAGESYRPAQAFSIFNGVALNGTWRLNVSDRANLDTGTLRGWCLLPQIPTQPVPVADIALSMTVEPDQAEVGETVLIEATVSNLGPDPATGVTLLIDLPEELELVTLSSSIIDKFSLAGGSPPDWICGVDGQQLDCSLSGGIPDAGISPILAIEAQVSDSAEPGLVSIEAGINAQQLDPDVENNLLSLALEITGAADAIFANGFECLKDCEPKPPSDIVVVDNVNFQPAATAIGGSIRWDTAETCDCDAAPFDMNIWATSGNIAFFWPRSTTTRGGVAAGTVLSVLSPGDTVGPGNTFVTAASSAGNTAPWRAGVNGFLGFRFVNPETGELNYGYARITTTAPTGFPVTILSYAYNRVGDPITIPSP